MSNQNLNIKMLNRSSYSIKEKEKISYLFTQYEIMWSYYKKTIDERNQMLRNYCMFTGIPSTLITILANSEILSEKSILGVLLLIISMVGLAFSFNYLSECVTANRYLNKIDRLGKKMIKYLNIDALWFQTKDIYNATHMDIINKTIKVTPIFLLNTLALSFGLLILDIPYLAIVAVLSLLLQITGCIFFLIKNI